MPQYEFTTQSDSEIILALYLAKGPAFLADLNGIFAFALYDAHENSYLIASDHMWIVPLYYGKDADEQLFPLHSFAIGLKGAPDSIAAKKAADHIGTIHREVNFTIQEGLDAICDVTYHLETYDVTTVRASAPMYLSARVIKSIGIKMVSSGEGSDELFGGYPYFHKAPDAYEFHKAPVRKLKKLYLYECLRANKSLAAWGVEGRVSFLDKTFMDVAMTINPADKMIQKGKMGKWVLRRAFEAYLPESIARRQKEQFSDGVGYSWIDTLKERAESDVTDVAFEMATARFPVHAPMSKEEFFTDRSLRRIFPPKPQQRRCRP